MKKSKKMPDRRKKKAVKRLSDRSILNRLEPKVRKQTGCRAVYCVSGCECFRVCAIGQCIIELKRRAIEAKDD